MKVQTVGTYLIKNNKILFLVRKKKHETMHQQGIYLPIGGKVELSEELEEAAIREVKEESGITVHSVDLKGILYIRSQNTGQYDVNMYTFISSDFEGEPINGNEGSFEWVDIQKIQSVSLYPGDKIYLDLMFKHNFFAIELLYKHYDLLQTKILKLL